MTPSLLPIVLMAILLSINNSGNMFIDSSILLNIQLFNLSLVWFLAIFSALLAISRSNIQCVDKLLLFVRDNTNNIEGVGHICSYSRFNFIDENQPQLKDNENNSNQSIHFVLISYLLQWFLMNIKFEL
eukprot:296811_1